MVGSIPTLLLPEKYMPSTLTAPQREELKTLLLAKQDELQAQMVQNEQNLVPPSVDVGAVLQLNEAREVNQALTNIDAADLGRIDLALKAMDDGSYGLCDECGCSIPLERLQIEPHTQHCVACKSRWEAQQTAR